MTFIPNFVDVDLLKKRFYEREKQFNNFRDLTFLRREEIVNDVKLFKNEMEKHATAKKQIPLLGLVLQYLLSKRIHFTYPTFDERVYFLIKAIDPTFTIYEIYLSYNIPSLIDINSVDNDLKKIFLQDRRKFLTTKFISEVKEKMGFYDYHLLNYENILIKQENILLHKMKPVKKDYSTAFFNDFVSNCDFKAIPLDRINFIQLKALEWQKLLPDESFFATVIYYILYYANGIGLKTCSERYMFLIFLIDSNFNFLNIYYDECTWDKISERCLAEFGFFKRELIFLEKKLKDDLYPEIIISDWQYKKKTD